MDGMNPFVASIYGTGGDGVEKIASADGQPLTLYDLALMVVTDETDEKPDLEKVAAAHKEVLDRFEEHDIAGRAMAHHEFSAMEKAAADGHPEALQAFFSEPEDETNDRDAVRQAVLAELARRQQ